MTFRGEMAEQTLDILIVGPDPQATQDFTEVYNEHFHFESAESTRTIHKALQSHRECDYDACFIFDDFDESELAAFFGDYEKLGKEKYCAFIQVRKKIPQEFDQESVKTLGFVSVVSMTATHADRELFAESVKDKSREKEIHRKKVDVKGALQVALRELDKAARNIRRGVAKSFNTLSVDFISTQTEFDEEILEKYYDDLSTKASEHEPDVAPQLDVPDQVLKRDLPNLSKGTYKGASDRVWKKLQKKYGLKDGPPNDE